MAKIALLIGVGEYQSGFEPLPATLKDVAAMQDVLQNANMGAFDQVIPLCNPGLFAMRQAIEDLFSDRAKDDLLLLYFAGHGVADEAGSFFFTNRETEKTVQGSLRRSTAVEASFVHGLMDNCRSDRQVVILDCCNSWAFPSGMKLRDDGTLDLKQQLGGRGRIVLTASSAASKYAIEQQSEDLAAYTRYLVEGIRTGAADLDGDGAISVDELHDYISQKLSQSAPKMKPERYVLQDGEKILLAKAIISDPKRQYRKKVREKIRNGKLSRLAIKTLREFADRWGVQLAEAEAIEAEELQPYREFEQKIDKYRAALREAFESEYPLTPDTQQELQDYLQALNLREQDVAAIVTEEHQRHEALLAQASQQQPPPPPPVPSFEFDVVTVNAKGKEQQRDRRRAEYLTENLGNGVALEMVAVPGGTFQMGSEEHDTEKPIHSVTIAPFFIGRYTITQSQWRIVAALPRVNRDLKPDPANFKGANRPVEQVSWEEAVEFCDRLSRKTGRTYRLPSEAEWEYACRAGTTTPFHCGETITTDLANYNGNYTYSSEPKGTYRKQTTEVGSFPANGFGLCDMHGNVWEWCGDRWHENYKGAPGDGGVWETGDSEYRVLRGGSWAAYPRSCRSANRGRNSPDSRCTFIGFRVVSVSARTF
jgi:formylglycine-generating enzyme required for sulfatase activity